MNAHRTLGPFAGCFVLLVALLTGCTSVPESAQDSQQAEGALPTVRMPAIFSNRSVEPIETLMAERAADTVVVTGVVTQRAALLEGWLYQVQDSTGSLWILSDRTQSAAVGPTVGAQVKVEGILRYEPIVVGEIDAGDVYLEETAYEETAELQDESE
ncbi:MAG: hypothetical protein AAFY33_11900 [Cyanobacteria bacterium J06643_4]